MSTADPCTNQQFTFSSSVEYTDNGGKNLSEGIKLLMKLWTLHQFSNSLFCPNSLESSRSEQYVHVIPYRVQRVTIIKTTCKSHMPKLRGQIRQNIPLAGKEPISPQAEGFLTMASRHQVLEVLKTLVLQPPYPMSVTQIGLQLTTIHASISKGPLLKNVEIILIKGALKSQIDYLSRRLLKNKTGEIKKSSQMANNKAIN